MADPPSPAGKAWTVLKATIGRFRGDAMTHHAAAVTYYSLLSLFPGLLVGVSLFGLIGERSTVDRFARYLTRHGVDATTVEAVRGSLRHGVESGTSSSLSLALGVALALWGASGAFGAVGQALNVVLRADEDRAFVHRKLLALASTALVIVLCAIAFVLVFLGGSVATDLFEKIGLGSAAGDIWNVARWPAAALLVMVIYAYVYWAAPTRTRSNGEASRRLRWISPGAVLGVLVWVLASAAFFLYVSNFSSYNKTYGAFAGAVILLVWLWLTNVALLLGAELNAVLDERASAHDDPLARVLE